MWVAVVNFWKWDGWTLEWSQTRKFKHIRATKHKNISMLFARRRGWQPNKWVNGIFHEKVWTEITFRRKTADEIFKRVGVGDTFPQTESLNKCSLCSLIYSSEVNIPLAPSPGRIGTFAFTRNKKQLKDEPKFVHSFCSKKRFKIKIYLGHIYPNFAQNFVPNEGR